MPKLVCLIFQALSFQLAVDLICYVLEYSVFRGDYMIGQLGLDMLIFFEGFYTFISSGFMEAMNQT